MRSLSRFALYALGLPAAGCAAGSAAGPAEPETGIATVAIGQRAEIGGVAVTPLRIEEDSRCPTGVQCIQAGTVRAAVRLEEDGGTRRETVLTLAKPLGLAADRWLTLAAVCPYPGRPGPIAPAAYRLTFALGPDEASPPGDACAA